MYIFLPRQILDIALHGIIANLRLAPLEHIPIKQRITPQYTLQVEPIGDRCSFF